MVRRSYKVYPSNYIKSSYTMTYPQRARIARNSVDPEELRRFARDDSDEVKLAVYLNGNTPEDVVTNLEYQLSDSVDSDIRCRIARNTLNPAILSKLSEDESWDVREAVADNTQDPAILEKLRGDENKYVRYTASNGRMR